MFNSVQMGIIMLSRYEKFLEEFDKRLAGYFELHKEYLHCKKGCSDCCEIGEYPMSRLEMEYLMKGYTTLSPEMQKQVKQNIDKISAQKAAAKIDRFMYQCPFLINKECVLYKYRGIVCRTFGLAYVDAGKVVLPECVNRGLNYSKLYNPDKKEIFINNPIKENLRTDKVLKNPETEQYKIECGIIKPLIEWFL